MTRARLSFLVRYRDFDKAKQFVLLDFSSNSHWYLSKCMVNFNNRSRFTGIVLFVISFVTAT